jgi:hypothetical protein
VISWIITWNEGNDNPRRAAEVPCDESRRQRQDVCRERPAVFEQAGIDLDRA